MGIENAKGEGTMKQRKLIQKVKRFLAGVIVAAMAITMFPTVPIIAAETQEAYPYTLFAGSSAEGAITVKGNACVNGKIATNGTAVFWGSSNNINGIITEHAGESMVDISAKLDKIYFVAENVEQVCQLGRIKLFYGCAEGGYG